MAKKNFSGGLNSLLENTSENNLSEKEETIQKVISKKRGRPKINFKEITSTSEEGTLPEETRATFIVKKETLEKIKAIAFWDRAQIKNVVHNALEAYIEEKGEKYLEQALKAFSQRS